MSEAMEEFTNSVIDIGERIDCLIQKRDKLESENRRLRAKITQINDRVVDRYYEEDGEFITDWLIVDLAEALHPKGEK